MAKKMVTEDYNLAEFKYVDVYHKNPQTDTNTRWIRTPIEQLEDFRSQWNNYNVFATVQMFRNKSRPKNGDYELQYAPLFFDIDSSRTLVCDTENTKRPSGLFELGMVHISTIQQYLPAQLAVHLSNYSMGIPLSDAVCLEINTLSSQLQELKNAVFLANMQATRADAVRLISFFKESFAMAEDEIRVYFSGSKGFHVLINPATIGLQPDQNLNRVFKYIVQLLEAQLGLQNIDTSSIYGSRRMLRLDRSVHHKSGLFKTEITHEELTGDLTVIINTLATSPRSDVHPIDTQYDINQKLNDWYTKHKESFEATTKIITDKAIKDVALTSMEDVPECVQYVLDRGIQKTGDRNKGTMALASYYKDTGTPMNEVIGILTKWAERIPKSLTSSSPVEVRASTVSCVKTIYEGNEHHFSCKYIRSLRGKDEAVPCGGKACPAHTEFLESAEPAEFMHLAQTARAEYTGKKVAFNALIAGKLDTPYIVPKVVKFICGHENNCDKECNMHDFSGIMEKEFSETERFMIEATGQNDNNLKGILRHHSGASCTKVGTQVTEFVNVSELLVVPMAERVKSNSKQTEDNVGSQEYVSRKVYSIGTEIEANSYYKIEGYVYSHPKNATATVLSQKYEPLEDSVALFQLTPEIIKDFEVFQVHEGETVDDRISVVVNDLTQNVTHVHERFEAHLAMLLTYHSCLNYYFQDQLEKRGWLETMLVGDSGQAKSLMVNNFMDWVGLGNAVSGEGASRTGLIYKLEQAGERWFLTWGRYPLSDRKLLLIDEFSELGTEDFGKITEARTTGVLKVDRMVSVETNARVRLLLLTNPKQSKTLKSFTHGVESLIPLFSSPADIRRLDLAVFLQSGDVDPGLLNREYKKPTSQIITDTNMRNSIMWAWSRKADHIHIMPDALTAILRASDKLADKYGHSQDIPLMEPSDLRKKLARLSNAVAIFTHYTDATHEHVFVTPAHVEYAVEYLELVYDNRNCRLDAYSAKSRTETELSQEEKDALHKLLGDLDFAENSPISDEILDLFRRHDALKPQEIIDMLGYERGQINTRISALNKFNMIKKTREGLRKLPKFVEYLGFD